MARNSILILVIMLVAALPLAGLAQESGQEVLLYQQDFQDGAASGWELEPGWAVIQDGDNYVLSGEGHAWARPQTDTWADYRLQFRLKLLRGRMHLVYRFNRDGRYYIGLQENGSDLNKQYWPDTFIPNLARRERAHGLNAWRQVEIVGQGSSLRLLVDGQLEWEYSDPEPLLYGSFAFETLEDGLAYVDDVQVWGAPPPTTIPGDLSGELAWVRSGGPLGGLGYDVRMRPDNPDVMYVTDAWAGVFMSSDGGQAWFPSNQGITTRTGSSGDAIPIFCLTIDLHNHDVIWAGTQNVRGIFKSTDGGRSWVRMDAGVIENDGITFRGFTIDPRSSEIVYAAAELSSWVWSGEPRSGREFDMTAGVVYKTADGGQNWFPVWRGDNLARYVWIDPRNADVIYISTGIFDREAANSDPQAGLPGGEGVLKSVDGGQTWAHANNGLNNLYVGSLFMHPENPDILLAGTGNNQYYRDNGVYLSTDGGASWQWTLQNDNITAVEFALSDPQIAYAGSAAAIYRSQDGGRSWQRVSGGVEGWGPPGVRAGFPIDFQVHPHDPDRIFANEYGGGNFLSSDGGRTWTVASAGYTGAQVRDIAVDPASWQVYAAARSGIFVSPDAGNSWLGLNRPPAYSMEWYAVATDPARAQHVLAANNWEGVILSSHDAGQRWLPVSGRPGEPIAWRSIAFAPSNPAVVYAGTSAFYSAGTFDDRLPAAGIYRSQDNGESWAPANDARSQDANVIDLAVAPNDPNTVYAATGNHGLLKSQDGGANWLDGGLPDNLPALSVAVHPADPSQIFAGLSFGGLYRSADGGATWTPVVAGFNPEASISDILFDPRNPQVMYFADLRSGVYRSADGGTTWRGINTGLRMRSVNKLAILPDGGHLFAATEGEGVFRLDLSGEPPRLPSPLPPRPAVTAQAQALAPTGEAAPPTAAPPSPSAPAQAPSGGVKLCRGALALPAALAGFFLYKRKKAKDIGI
ncbi:MAG: hypothetical protein JXA78_07855 [Anaerolineales bacterium]|nr:hypothetical protein [Anaerolineales bacterium]